jgi:hypothetical protein
MLEASALQRADIDYGVLADIGYGALADIDYGVLNVC